tara:strand:- start:4030 stop:5679 length:1650 start_codon:yes stop_codon:yes gene_type:complete
MAYKINNTFGTLLVTLPDGTIDTTTTDLALFGKSYAGFGESLNENLVKLLENFNNTSAPNNKIQGQLWFDKTNKQINVYDGIKFKPVGSPTPSTSQPANAVLGDEWFDTNANQFYIYNGADWTLIGPTTVAGSGVTQVITETAPDNTGVNQTYLKLVSNDAVVGVVSDVAFTPSATDTTAQALVSAGYSTVAQGIQLSSSVAAVKFRGTATDADGMGGVAAANYLRSDSNDTTSGRLTVQNDLGIRLGGGLDVTMSMTGDDFTIANTTSNGDIAFTLNSTTLGGTKKVMDMDGGTGRVNIFEGGDITCDNLTVRGTQVIMNTSTLSVEDNIIELNRNISSNAATPKFTGLKVKRGSASSVTEQDLFWVWDETFADDGSTTYGNAGGAWTAFKSGGGDTELSAPTLVDVRANVVHATTTSAMYADLAERYEADCETEMGDVVMLGGHAEITKCNKELCDQVFGVISDSPAFLMNAQAGNNDSHPMVALKGRVFVKIQGTGKAGDRIVSAGNGEGRVADLEECTAFNTLGRLIKDKYNKETALTECVIGVK